MSAQFEASAVDLVPVAPLPSAKEIEAAWRQAWEARGHAAAIGDYVAAERWHDRARALATQLEAREQDAVIVSPR
jgi:hypothetical protein